MARPQKKQRPDRAPVSNDNAAQLKQTVAPWPQVDRWPVVLGSNLTLAYLASVYRICQNGYRQQYVDALDELLEKDPATQGALTQRVLPVASGRVEILAAHVADKLSAEAEKAREIAADIQRRVDAIPQRTKAFFSILFSALYYGAGADEIHWKVDEDGWNVAGLGFVHSRRIAWPDQNDWSAHVWDQGAVMPTTIGLYPTERFFGLRLEDYPGKFLFLDAQLRADYPTRDGIGRVIAWWMALKLMAIRAASTYVERFSNPWVHTTYNTADPSHANAGPRIATDEDIAVADAATKALGAGTLSAATLPDSIKITLSGPGAGGGAVAFTPEDLIALCDKQIIQAIRGGTLVADAGEKGARALGEVHAQGDIRNNRYDASCFADVLKAGLVWWLCHLNYPGYEHLCPNVMVHVEQVEPAEIAERVKLFAALGGRPEGRWLAERLGIRIFDAEDPKGIPLAPVKPADLFALTASAESLASTIEGLAGLSGINVTPALRTAIAEMDRDDVARLLQGLLGGAKDGQRAADDAAEVGRAPEPPKPTQRPQKRQPKTTKATRGAPTTTDAPARGGKTEDPSAAADPTED